MPNAAQLRAQAADLTTKAEAFLQTDYKSAEERKAGLAKGQEMMTEAGSLVDQAELIEKIEERSRKAAAETQHVEVHNNEADRPWGDGERGVGEFLIAVANASRPGGSFDPRLEGRSASGLNTKIGADGGFVVGKDETNTILRRVYELANLASRCTRIPVSANSDGVRIPYVDEISRATGSRWGGVRAYWMDQADALTASKPKIGKWELDLGKIGAVGYATSELLADAGLMASIMLEAFGSEIAFELDEAILRGDGNGKPKGIIGNAAATVSVAKETSQTADTVNWNNVAKMFGRVAPGSVLRGQWYINQGVYADLLLMTSAATSAATPMFTAPGSVADAPFGALYGRPIRVIEHASAIGDVGDIMYLDLSEYVLIDKGGMQSAESMHVRFLNDEMAFRLVYRVNGHPKWKTIPTPFKGSASVAPFVTLDAR